MKRLISNTLLLLSASLIGFSSPSVIAQDLVKLQNKNTIRVAIANEIPYGYMDFNGKAMGIGPDVLSAIMPALGIENIQWVATNFSSLIPGLKANRFDVVAAEMAILPERCKSVIYSEPNSSYGENLLVLNGNPKNIHSYHDIINNDYKVAIMAGADQLEIVQALGIKDSNIINIASNSDAISTVATGRADAYAATILTVAGLAEKSQRVSAVADFQDPVVNGHTVRSYGGFTFAKNSTQLRDSFNKELAKFKQSPEWQQILIKYGLTQHDLDASNSKTTAELCQ